MRMLPLWRDAKALTHTLRYDFAAARRDAAGRCRCPPSAGAACTAPTIVLVGSKSEAFFHHTARSLADALPTAEYESLEGAHHGSPRDVARGDRRAHHRAVRSRLTTGIASSDWH